MKKKLFSVTLSILLLCGLLAGCSTTKDTASTTKKGASKVVLNEVAHSIFYAPMYVAIEEGYFAEEGLDVELVTGFDVIL